MYLNPEEPLTDIRYIIENYTQLEMDDYSYYLQPQNTLDKKIDNGHEVSFNLSTISLLGHRNTPHIYSKSQVHKLKMFGTKMPIYPILKELLTNLRNKDVVYLKMEPHQHKIPNRNEGLFFRLEVTDLSENKLPFNQMSIEQKMEYLSNEKQTADQFFGAKNFEKAIEIYSSLFNYFKGLEKKKKKELSAELLKKYTEIGNRICKNLVRCFWNKKMFPEALEILNYLRNHDAENDWSVFSLYLSVLKSMGGWSLLEDKLNAVDESTINQMANFSRVEFDKWKWEVVQKNLGEGNQRLMGKALKEAIINGDKEKQREKKFAMLNEEGQRVLTQN